MTVPNAPEALTDFELPGSITSFKPADHKGQLVLIWAHAVKPHTEDSGKVVDVTEVDVVVLDQPGGPVKYEGCAMFQKILQARVRRNVGTGKPSLGRITQRPPLQKNQSPYWDLDDPSDADKNMARSYLASPTAKPASMSTSDGAGGFGGGGSSVDPPF
jgi:hypothetical protein